MERGVGSIWCLLPLVAGLLSGCCSGGEIVTVVLDVYTHNTTLTFGDSVPFGTQIIIICQVVGLPYGTPLNYTWACSNGPCEVEGYYGRKIYNEHILAVNTTTTSDGGTYTCQVTAAGGQEATGSFTLGVTGGDVVHSYGRLIPFEFPITDLQQISGSDGIGRITCTVSSGTARFVANGRHVQLETGGVSQTRNGATSTLVVKPSNVGSFQNRDLYCSDPVTNFFYLFISSANPLRVPSLMVDRVTNSTVEYQVQRNDAITNPLITGYEVTRFGVSMIREYVNAGRGRRVTISPAVPGAQYRITAWALGNGRRSATPAVEYVTVREASPSSSRIPSITREFQDGTELNWLPPTEPNGEVHYVISYTPEGGTEQSIDTGSNLTHYNLTGLERNRVYTNIAVHAVNSVGRSDRSAVIAQYNHTPPYTPGTAAGSPTPPGPSSTAVPPPAGQRSPGNSALIAGVVVALLVVVVLLLLVGGVVAVVLWVRRKKMMEAGQSSSKAEDSQHEGEVKINMYQNVNNQPTAASGHNEPYYSTAVDTFINPASATASFKTHMYDSANEIDREPTDVGGGELNEEAKVEERWDGGGYHKEPEKHVSGKQKKSAVRKVNTRLVNPEELYAEPNKVKKKNAKKDSQASRTEETAVPSDELYAKPDMTKKKDQRSKQDSEQERKLPPQAPLSYKKHKEAMHESEEDGEDVPEVPPPYVPDEEQCYNTRGGAGPSFLERRYDYAALDWQQK